MGRSVRAGWLRSSSSVCPANGARPVSIYHSVTPSEYRSARASTDPWLNCSGLAYAGVPTNPPRVKSASVGEMATALANPKSTTFTSMVPVDSRRLLGFRSR